MSEAENRKTANHFKDRGPVFRASTRNLSCVILSMIMGLFIGWLDLQITEVIVTILALLLCGLLLGLIQPRAAWRWASLIAIGLPMMEFIAIQFSLQTAEPVQFDIRIALVAWVFAMLGSYMGVFIRTLIRS